MNYVVAIDNFNVNNSFLVNLSNYINKRLNDLNINSYIINNSNSNITNDEKIQIVKQRSSTGNNVILLSNRLNGSNVEIIYALRNNDLLAENIYDAFVLNNIEVEKYYQKRDELEAKAKTILSLQEIADALELEIDEVVKYESVIMDTCSLNTPLSPEKDSELVEFIQDEDTNIEDVVLEKDACCEIRKILNKLGERERTIIESRFGFDDGEAKTLEQTAEILYKKGITKTKVTRERIRQLEAKTLKRLSCPANKNKLKVLFKEY